jgi:hypothetical protein
VTIKEFNSEIEKLEACWPSRTDADRTVARRDVLWERLRETPAEVLHEARNSLIDAGLEFLPSVPEIIEACREVEEASKPKGRMLRKRHKEAAHQCSPQKPEASDALTELSWVFPYEAEHILCPADIKATCPLCGKQSIVTGLFDGIVNNHPADQTRGWTRNFKGLMVCDGCGKRVTR